ncbi:hypothetical protein [Lysinibacillus sp. RS5]|uniref:hypothetical protein n=1 Tax=unclassified Lysinibacillus TaxID=2636778 RepID=UPI0035BE3E47
MQISFCFLSLFALNGLVLGSMESDFLIDIYGNTGKDISLVFGIPLLYLIRNYYKEIKGLVFGLLFLLSFFLYMGLITFFVV